MKKSNIARLVWVTSIFLELFVILVMVVDYKVHYQYLTIHKLYFYECTGTLCVTEVKDDEHLLYSAYECGYEDCPTYKKEIGDTYVLLTEGNDCILYDYRTGTVISRDYDDYLFINNDYLIVTKNGLQGIINIENQLIVSSDYEQIGYFQDEYLIGYNVSSIIAKKDDQYGIISFKTGKIIEPFKYDEANINELLEILKKEVS